LSETHQRVLLNIILRMQMSNDQQQNMALSQIHDTISTLSMSAAVIGDNTIRIDSERFSHRKSLQDLIQEFSSVAELVTENEYDFNRINAVYDLSGQEIGLLKQRLENGRIISFDGTLMWKISNVEQLIGMYLIEFVNI
jgi:hypothetical protein